MPTRAAIHARPSSPADYACERIWHSFPIRDADFQPNLLTPFVITLLCRYGRPAPFLAFDGIVVPPFVPLFLYSNMLARSVYL